MSGPADAMNERERRPHTGADSIGHPRPPRSGSTVPTPPASTFQTVVSLIQAVAWPSIVALAFLRFEGPLTQLVGRTNEATFKGPGGTELTLKAFVASGEQKIVDEVTLVQATPLPVVTLQDAPKGSPSDIPSLIAKGIQALDFTYLLISPLASMSLPLRKFVDVTTASTIQTSGDRTLQPQFFVARREGRADPNALGAGSGAHRAGPGADGAGNGTGGQALWAAEDAGQFLGAALAGPEIQPRG